MTDGKFDLSPGTPEPRAWTEDEVIEKLMRNFRNNAKYWATVALGKEHNFKNAEEELLWRCEGVAFSMLAALDGSSMDLPGIDLVLCPHEDDKQYSIDNGENWFEPEMRISTTLHEYFHKRN